LDEQKFGEANFTKLNYQEVTTPALPRDMHIFYALICQSHGIRTNTNVHQRDSSVFRK